MRREVERVSKDKWLGATIHEKFELQPTRQNLMHIRKLAKAGIKSNFLLPELIKL